MVKIGMMIGDRYEVLEKIGTGGMSDVYKSKDHKLNRFVAVKVLKSEFSENANFVSKFTIEAQAAAGLMHPNIVNVYDVGEENGINYIVMELVEGITLKKYIERKARLSVKEAVTIAIQIGMGIEAAHNNHIIHRDIKPQNVIISKEGKVKVTDFGIAKAATSNTITSNVMGSVHYTSPEQARGGFSDEKSDIYSLGITLFEMLTGRVPFNGETTVAIAIKQIQEEMPSPREFVDDIPVSVEQIVLKCTQKSPDRRYQSMGALIDDLKKSFINPDEDFVMLNKSDEMGETRTLSEGDMESLKNNIKAGHDFTDELPKINPNAEKNDSDLDKRLDKVNMILAIVVGCVFLFAIVFGLCKLLGAWKNSKENPGITPTSVSVEKPRQIVMPKVTEMSYEKAQLVLEQNNLGCKIVYRESETEKEGTVLSSSIKEGLKVDVGTEIVIYVSSGPTSVLVPEVVGKHYVEANSDLLAANFKIEVLQEYSADVAEGMVISQSPEGGEKAPAESTVTITISKGAAEDLVAVPNLIGKWYDDAVLELREKGFIDSPAASVYDSVFPEGVVCFQNIKEGEMLPKGSTVVIQVSKGPEPQAAVLYRYNASINAPSTAEDPDFESGTRVKIVITGLNGKELYSAETTSFPTPVNLWNISGCNSGVITLEYEVDIPAVMGTDISGNEVEETPATKETRTIKREINFELQQ